MAQPSPRTPMAPRAPYAPMQPLEQMAPMEPLVPLRPGERRISDPAERAASVVQGEPHVPSAEQLAMSALPQYQYQPLPSIHQQPVINLGLSEPPTGNWSGIPRPRLPVGVRRPSGSGNKAVAVIGVAVALIVGLAALGSRSSSGSHPVAIPSISMSIPPISIGTQHAPPPRHPTQSGQSQATHQSGRTLSLNGSISGERIRVTFIRYANNATSKDTFFGPSRGKRYFAAQFRITNTGSVVYVDSPANGARVIDTKGKSYRTTFLVSKLRLGKVFEAAVSLKTGESEVGYLVFEVPKNRKIHQVQFAENSGFGQVGTWTFVK